MLGEIIRHNEDSMSKYKIKMTPSGSVTHPVKLVSKTFDSFFLRDALSVHFTVHGFSEVEVLDVKSNTAGSMFDI